MAITGSSSFGGDQRNAIPIPTDSGTTATEIFGARISNEGDVLDPEGLVIATGARSVSPYTRIASNSSSYLVVFGDNNGTRQGITEDDTIKAKIIIDPEKYLVLSEPRRGETEDIEFRFNAAPGHAFSIEWTNEEFDQWTELQRFENFSGEELITDPIPFQSGQRVYRARKLEVPQ